MASTLSSLMDKGLVTDAPGFLKSNVHYEVIMGSMAYGVSSDTSDMDIYGFAIPPKEDVFPHLRGEIPLFDPCEPQFKQFQKHKIIDNTALGGKGREYDITLYSIAKYFRLLTDNNPNIIDSLFVPQSCVLHATPLAQRIREKRNIFLHRGCWAKFKGYAYAQIHKMESKQPQGKRKALVDTHGYDVKFAYHVVRLLNEVEQLLLEGDMDLMRHSEQLKSIRRGEWSLDKVKQYFADKEKSLENLYLSCALPERPDVAQIRQLLLESLEAHFGSLDAIVTKTDKATQALTAIKQVLNEYGC